MDKLIRSIYIDDLSGTDINIITRGKAPIRLYTDLLKYKNIIDFIGKTQQCILLFPVQSNISGHWVYIAIDTKNKIINHWDSYALTYQQERAYTNNNLVKQHLLGDKYQQAINAGYTIINNSYKLQQMKTGINDCGRWASLRCRFSYLNNDEFARLFLNQTMSPDWYVTALTFIALAEDIKDEEEIIRDLSGK